MSNLEIITNEVKNMRRLLKNTYFKFDRNRFMSMDSFLKQFLLDRIFIENASNLSLLSHCISRQVGCIIAKDGRTLATGINGTSENEVNCDELFDHDHSDMKAHRAWSDVHEIHAEMNAINWAAKHGRALNNSTLYCTLQPCLQCSKNIPAVGINRIVFRDFYDRVENYEEQKKYLQSKGVIIIKLSPDEEILKYISEVKLILEKYDG